MVEKVLYHYTSRENLGSILALGLEPRSVIPLTPRGGVFHPKFDIRGEITGGEKKWGHTKGTWLTRDANAFHLGEVRITFRFVVDPKDVSSCKSPLTKWRSFIVKHNLPEEVYREAGGNVTGCDELNDWYIFDGTLQVISHPTKNAFGVTTGFYSPMVYVKSNTGIGVVQGISGECDGTGGGLLVPFEEVSGVVVEKVLVGGVNSAFVSLRQLAADLSALERMGEGLLEGVSSEVLDVGSESPSVSSMVDVEVPV